MKKQLVIGIFLMLVLTSLAIIPNSVGADPVTVNLLAGQTNDIGDITVWNDCCNLYVEFDTTDSGEQMLETHLHVATDWTLIPQTKKNNPIPGQFEYNDFHSGGTLYFLYTIPLSWPSGTELCIAAHASLGQEQEMIFYSGPGIDVYGPLTSYAPVGDAAWGTTPGSSVDTWTHPSWPTITGASWISNSYYIEEPIAASTWRWFNHEFTVPGYPLSGTIEVTADNAEDVYLNGILVGSDGEIQDPWADNHEWNTIIPYDIYPLEGLNDLDIIVRNYPGSSSPTSNPTGLIYKVIINYLEKGETAWGEGTQFPGKNWAMYFCYTVQAMQCPDIIDKSSNVEVINSPPSDVRVGVYESDDYVRVWKEFQGTLATDLYYDLDEGLSARTHGPPAVTPYISVGTDVCIYYVHLDNIGPSSTVQKTGQITFGADILGLIISGGSLGTFAGRDLMFAADNSIGYSGTIYPTMSTPDYWRGFDVNYGSNLDDAIFIGPTVDFTMWVVNAHDSFRVILPLV
jgi:hypothetical protein